MRFPFFTPVMVIVAGLFLSACNGEEEAPAAPPPPEVTVANPLVKPIIDWDRYVGQFEAVERVQLRPRVTGYLVEVNFEDGQMVEAGDRMFRIDPRPFEAALAEAESRVTGAEARLVNARSELERASGLVDIQAVSQEEYDALQAAVRTAESELEAAQAAKRAAELNVEYTTITAPIDGRASYRRVDVGNAVRADDTVLTTIVSMDPIHFVFEGSEALYLKYRREQSGAGRGDTAVRIRLQGEEDFRWAGRLTFLDNTVDPDSGTIRGRARVPNPDGFLTPGMFGQMELQASEEYPGILLPDSAIATRGAQRIVYVVDEEGVLATRDVVLGPLHHGLRVIRAGLAEQDRVVINGQQRARPGQPVQPIMSRIEDPAQNAEPVEMANIPNGGSAAISR